MTDLYDYLRMLFATVGLAHCPYCRREILLKTVHQMAEHLLSLPRGAEVEIRAPVFKLHGEDYAFLFDEIRALGHLRLRLDSKEVDIGGFYDHIRRLFAATPPGEEER